MAGKTKVRPSATVEGVLELIRALRADDGCPWDRKQTPLSLVAYLVEEIYELVEAIVADDGDAIREELGDVFFQLFFLVFLYQQKETLSLDGVFEQNIVKMIRRHPHVFGTEKLENADQVKKQWRDIKSQEKKITGSIMDTVPSGMPSLMRAYRVSERAIGVGFDWPDLQAVIEQSEGEWNEFKSEMRQDAEDCYGPESRVALEFGDVLFSLVNVARRAGFHPEIALQRSTAKFIERFKAMEASAARKNTALDRLNRTELEQMWVEAKQGEEAYRTTDVEGLPQSK
jgi:tetrapyrrole methylase family protein/MazG family protein